MDIYDTLSYTGIDREISENAKFEAIPTLELERFFTGQKSGAIDIEKIKLTERIIKDSARNKQKQTMTKTKD